MADILSSDDVLLLRKAIAYGRASKLAQVIYAMDSVMICIKNLLLENSDPTETSASTTVRVDSSPTHSVNPSKDGLNKGIFSGKELSAHEMSVDSAAKAEGIEDCDPPVDSSGYLNHTHVNSEQDTAAEIKRFGDRGEQILPKAESTSLAQKLTEMTAKASALAEKSDCDSSIQKSKKRKARPKHADIKASEVRFTCEKCGYQTRRKDHFKRHCISHSGEKPFKCHLCKFSSVDKYHLVRHLKSSLHNNGTGKDRNTVLECDSCDYQTKQSGRMERHKRTHSGEKPFSCNFCAYKAAQRATLERHILTHTGEKPFKCDKCDYSSADTKSLRFHTLQKHGNGTIHQCPECGYSTPVLRYYKLHLRTHSDARPYLCDMCGYAAKRPHGLTKHYRAMHGWTMADTDGKTYRRLTNHLPGEVQSEESDLTTQSIPTGCPPLPPLTYHSCTTGTKSNIPDSLDSHLNTSDSQMDIHHQSMTSPNQPTMSQGHSMTVNQPMASQNIQMTSQNQPMTLQNLPIASQNHPMTSQSHPIMTSQNHQIMASHSQPMLPQNQPVAAQMPNESSVSSALPPITSNQLDTYLMDSMINGCQAPQHHAGSIPQNTEQTSYPFYL